MSIGIPSRRAWLTTSLTLTLLIIGVPATATEAAGQTAVAVSGDANHARLLPVQVRKGSRNLTSVKAIGIGYAHSCAVRTDGFALCWGSDSHGQLGDGTNGDVNQNRLKPVKVHLPT